VSIRKTRLGSGCTFTVCLGAGDAPASSSDTSKAEFFLLAGNN